VNRRLGKDISTTKNKIPATRRPKRFTGLAQILERAQVETIAFRQVGNSKGTWDRRLSLKPWERDAGGFKDGVEAGRVTTCCAGKLGGWLSFRQLRRRCLDGDEQP
jgi:hypothetical protein